jgi:exodeoxyribonuclease VII large subunit
VGLANSAESPLPVRTVARSLMEWIDKLGRVWVEGQVTQVNRRSGTCYLVLRDPVADMSLNVVCARTLLDSVVPPLSEGDRVVVHAKPEFYAGRGTLNLKAIEIRPVGVGRAAGPAGAAQGADGRRGLFAADRKKAAALPPPPGRAGHRAGRRGRARRAGERPAALAGRRLRRPRGGGAGPPGRRAGDRRPARRWTPCGRST